MTMKIAFNFLPTILLLTTSCFILLVHGILLSANNIVDLEVDIDTLGTSSSSSSPIVNDQDTTKQQRSTCNIPIVYSFSIFQTYSLPTTPMIIIDKNHSNIFLAEFGQRDHILATHGSQLVDLSSSNTYSHGQYRMSLTEFITNHVDVDIETSQSHSSNDTMYLFGKNHETLLFQHMAQLYQNPPCRYCKKAGVASIGIGGHGTGVAFHFHGPGVSEGVIGRKQWFIFPPEYDIPGSHPNISVSVWAREQLPTLMQRDDELRGVFFHCDIGPGEVLYFPDRWLHATLNRDSYNFFVSLFLDVQLMKD